MARFETFQMPKFQKGASKYLEGFYLGYWRIVFGIWRETAESKSGIAKKANLLFKREHRASSFLDCCCCCQDKSQTIAHSFESFRRKLMGLDWEGTLYPPTNRL